MHDYVQVRRAWGQLMHDAELPAVARRCDANQPLEWWVPKWAAVVCAACLRRDDDVLIESSSHNKHTVRFWSKEHIAAMRREYTTVTGCPVPDIIDGVWVAYLLYRVDADTELRATILAMAELGATPHLDAVRRLLEDL